MAEFSTFTIPAGNGAGPALAVADGVARTVIVSGAFLGLIVIEGSVDGVNWVTLETFQRTDFRTILTPLPLLRVRRVGVPAVGSPGLPSVSVGNCLLPTSEIILPPPAGLNGVGVAVATDLLLIEAFVAQGSFPAGAVVSVDISEDGVNFVPLVASCTMACQRLQRQVAAFARMRVRGRTSPDPLPTIAVGGREATTAIVVLPPPALNGFGAPVSTARLDAEKTVLFCSATGDVPGQMTVQGSNDGGLTWCDVVASNVVALRNIVGVFDMMRLEVEGLTSPVALSVGVGALACDCPEPVEGESSSDVSLGGT